MLNNAMSVVILAAGKGTRMYSDLPKVLHTLAGKAMVQHVIDAANELGAAHVHLVYGHGGDLLKQALKDDNLNWVLQAEQLGTGHAMQQAAPFFADDEDILMLYGDVPLISVETLQRLRDAKPQGGIGLLTVKLDDPTVMDVSPVKTAKLPALLSTKMPPTSSVRFRRSTPAF